MYFFSVIRTKFRAARRPKIEKVCISLYNMEQQILSVRYKFHNVNPVETLVIV